MSNKKEVSASIRFLLRYLKDGTSNAEKVLGRLLELADKEEISFSDLISEEELGVAWQKGKRKLPAKAFLGLLKRNEDNALSVFEHLHSIFEQSGLTPEDIGTSEEKIVALVFGVPSEEESSAVLQNA